MVFRQIINRDLGCASYFLADGGEAAVVDPRLEIEGYLEAAAEEGVRIAFALDTHLHADHVSGRERLAAATGAQALRPGEGGSLEPGTTIDIGNLRLSAEAAPGHRPEHVAIVVSDLSRGEEPWLVLTGDSLLVGDLARPDLAVDSRRGARTLHTTLGRLVALGDAVEVWPGHVGGSLCGGAGLSGKTSSTIGFERAHNPLLTAEPGAFVDLLTADLPPKPPNTPRIVELNSARSVASPADVALLDAAALAAAVAAGAQVLDGRSPEQFDDGHLVGAIWLPPGRSQGTRAGWAVEPDDTLVVIGTDAAHCDRIAKALHAVGLWKVVGVSTAGADEWAAAGLNVRQTTPWDLPTLADRLRSGEVRLIDVRDDDEWEDCHVPDSLSVPLHRLRDFPGSLGDQPIAVACAGGSRAAFAASVIRRDLPAAEVVRVAGGGIAGLAHHGILLR